WHALRAAYTSETTQYFLKQYSTLLNLQFNHSQNMSDYCNKFNVAWNRLQTICDNSLESDRNDMPFLLNGFFKSDNCRSQLFLRSLPMDMDNVCDNLLLNG